MRWRGCFCSCSRRRLALGILSVCVLYLLLVLTPFHLSQHSLLPSSLLPPTSTDRRAALLLSHAPLYCPYDAQGEGEGDTKGELQGLWRAALVRRMVSHREISAAITAAATATAVNTMNGVSSLDTGELLRQLLLVGDFSLPPCVRPGFLHQRMSVSLEDVLRLRTVREQQTGSASDAIGRDMGMDVDVDARHPPVVLFESFPTAADIHTQRERDKDSLSSLFRYADDLLRFVRVLREVYDNAVIVWALPPHTARLQGEQRLLFHHLLLQQAVLREGLIVVPLRPDGETVRLLSSQLAALFRRTQTHRQAHTQTQAPLFSPANAHVDVRVALSEIAEYLRPLHRRDVGDEKNNNVSTSNETKSPPTIDNRKKTESPRNISLDDSCTHLLNSRKYTACFPEPVLRRPLLITGLGGTGTHFITQELRNLGFDVKHEGLGRQGAVSWFYAVNDVLSNVTYPFGALSGTDRSFFNTRFDHVVHVVREPLAQISSFSSHSNKSYQFVHDVVTQRFANLFHRKFLDMFTEAHRRQNECWRAGSCHLAFSALSWVAWNRIVHRTADITFRINEADAILNYACAILWPEYDPSSAKNSSCVTMRKHFLTTHPLRKLWALRGSQTPSSQRIHSKFTSEDIRLLGGDIFSLVQKEAQHYGFVI